MHRVLSILENYSQATKAAISQATKQLLNTKAIKLATKVANYIRLYSPLSLRGALILALSTLCLFYYALPNSDLSASIISSFLLALCALILVVGLIAKRRVKNLLSAELVFDQNNLFSREDIDSGIILNSLKVPALHRVAIKRLFTMPGAKSPTHHIRGNPLMGETLRVLDSCHFEHRGNWELQGIEVCLQDFLGLCSYSWIIPQRELIEIRAPIAETRPLPIVAASSQPGDLLQHTDNRTGDLFDIKAYDPSDGTKRILWKTYAKSRQLVVRRPEPAMVPEGEVAIFCLARKNDDHVASAALAYIEQLERNNIVVLFGCDSLPAKEYLDFAKPCVSGSEAARALTLDVWLETLGSGEQFPRFIEELQSKNKFPMQILFYIDKEQLVNQSSSGVLTKMNQLSEQYRVQPVFVVVDRGFLDPRAYLEPGAKKRMGSLTPLRSAPTDSSYGSLSTTILEAERAEA